MSEDSLPPSFSDEDRKRIGELHRALLRLHKILLDDEKMAYELVHGPVGPVGGFLDLVMYDPWFDWLHRLSRLVVEIDEVTESIEVTAGAARDLAHHAAGLLVPRGEASAEVEVFRKRYKAVLQRNSSAVLAHAEALRSIHQLLK